MTLPPDTVAHAFAQSAARFGARPFLSPCCRKRRSIYGIAAGETSYAQAQERIDGLRAAYAAAGYGHGHRVGLLLENRPDFFWHWFALNGAGRLGGADQRRPARRRARVPDRPFGDRAGRCPAQIAMRTLHAAARAAGRPLAVMAAGDAPPAAAVPGAAGAAAHRRARPNARCSTPRARPGGPRAASCPIAISCTPAPGMPASAAWRNCTPARSAC